MISLGVRLSKGKSESMKSQSAVITAVSADMSLEATLARNIYKTSRYPWRRPSPGVGVQLLLVRLARRGRQSARSGRGAGGWGLWVVRPGQVGWPFQPTVPDVCGREGGRDRARSGQTVEPVNNTLSTKTRAHFAAEEMEALRRSSVFRSQEGGRCRPPPSLGRLLANRIGLIRGRAFWFYCARSWAS